ncbi:MAG: sugar transferase [Anaerolineaceae bacterium]|nr:sugar transferase [Anaerolineaceae bacterium]
MSRAEEFIDKQFNERHRWQSPPVTRDTMLQRFTKRTFDIIISFFGLLILSPFFLYIAYRIKRDSPGPIYYHGPRIGYKGKTFKIYKFRTMYECPDSYTGPRLTGNGDQRITPFGSFLRDTKLNELPNLLNVLKGEMSFVGPRPEDPEIIAQWPDDVREEILSVRPGMTSPASITYRNEEQILSSHNVMDEYLSKVMPEKLRLDQLYVRHHTFLGDLDVIFATLTMLLPGMRKKQVAETALFQGPLTSFVRKNLTWFLADSLVALIAISLSVLIWRIHTPLNLGVWRVLANSVVLATGLAIFNNLFGLKQISWRYASPLYVIGLGISTSLSILLYSLVSYLLPALFMPVGLRINLGIFAFIGFVLVRYRERLITGLATRWTRWRSQRSMIGERVLIIGAGDAGQLAIWLLEKSAMANAFSIVGIVDDDYRKVDQYINGYKVLGTTNEIPAIVNQNNIGLILFAISRLSEKDRRRILDKCQGLPARILMITDLLQLIRNYFVRQAKEVTSE